MGGDSTKVLAFGILCFKHALDGKEHREATAVGQWMLLCWLIAESVASIRPISPADQLEVSSIFKESFTPMLPQLRKRRVK